MSVYPKSVLNLIDNLENLPGVGKKTAERLAFHMISAPAKETQSLARSIWNMKERVRLCSFCFGLSDENICPICSDPARDRQILCVVSGIPEMAAIEKSGSFTGLYHVLRGLLSPMDGIGPDDIRIPELIKRVEKSGIREVILAMGTHVEGEATASYIAGRLEKFSVKITRIASGVPMGGDLRYIDQMTIKLAMEGRHVISC